VKDSAMRWALSMGPGAALELARPDAEFSVHSAFPGTVNLQRRGSPLLVAFGGPESWLLPHAVAMDRPLGLLAPGSPVRREGERIMLEGITVDLTTACRQPLRKLPRVHGLPASLGPCAARLRHLQLASGHDLRWGQPVDGDPPLSPMGLRLEAAVRAFLERHSAVHDLVGLGVGLTPSGDDFLCGFLAGLRCRGQVLGVDLEAGLGATGDISASLLRWAGLGYWPEPLIDLAVAMVGEQASEAVLALEVLCTLGHTSGADMATGLFSGLQLHRSPTCPSSILATPSLISEKGVLHWITSHAWRFT